MKQAAQGAQRRPRTMQRLTFDHFMEPPPPVIDGAEPQHRMIRREQPLRAPELELRTIKDKINLGPFRARQRAIGVGNFREN